MNWWNEVHVCTAPPVLPKSGGLAGVATASPKGEPRRPDGLPLYTRNLDDFAGLGDLVQVIGA